MLVDWSACLRVLQEVYSDFGFTDSFDSDSEYLSEAFEFTEQLWNKQFAHISDIKVVMFSEAPLFGEKKAYIYNPDTKPSSFFYFNDLIPIVGHSNFQSNFKTPESKKTFLIHTMAENGFLILDVFPFALNPQSTMLNYQSMNSTLYDRLLRECSQFYLQPKLELIKKHSSEISVFIYRYQKLIDRTNRFIDSMLKKLTMIPPGTQLKCIGGTNMSLDRTKLSAIF